MIWKNEWKHIEIWSNNALKLKIRFTLNRETEKFVNDKYLYGNDKKILD